MRRHPTHDLIRGILLAPWLWLCGCDGDDPPPDLGVGGSQTGDASADAASGSACAAPRLGPGEAESIELTHGGESRRYLVHVPPSLSAREAAPLVVAYHDAASSPEQLARESGLDDAAEAHGFVVVYPEARHGQFNAGRWIGRFADPPHDADDVGFTRALVDDVATRLCVDADRVYSVGLGTGGAMSAWNACSNADLFAAVATVGSGTKLHLLGCDPERALPVIALDAQNDPTPGSAYAGAAWELEQLAAHAGCGAEPEREDVGKDYCEHYRGCDDGVELTHCTLVSSDHCWFGSEASCGTWQRELSATERIWEFFARFERPHGAADREPPARPDGGAARAIDVVAEPVELPDPARPAPGCGAPAIEPGAELTVELEHGGLLRSYLLHVPPSLDPATPAPLLFDFHGATATPELEALGSGMSEKADEQGFLVVYPAGVGAVFNAGSCCTLFGPQVPPEPADDAGFTRAILRDVASKLCVDLRRVYATGTSNGGWMSEWTACRNADVFAAVAPIVGMGAAQPDCAPSRPVPMMAWNFLDDPIVSYAVSDFEFRVWLDERNGCRGAPERETFEGGACERWTECEGGVEMVRCSMEGMDHCFPGSALCPDTAPAHFARDRVWAFLSRFMLPLPD